MNRLWDASSSLAKMPPAPSRKRSAQDLAQPELKLAGSDCALRVVLRHVVLQLDALSRCLRAGPPRLMNYQLDRMLCDTNCL